MLRLPYFHYHVPESVDEAIGLKAQHGPLASYVAGGTDLYPNMKRRQQEPHHVVQLSHLDDLCGIRRQDDGTIRVGACATLTEVSESRLLREECAALAEAARTVATPLLRNMGTLGGNLCLDTRCNCYDQTYEWRRGIGFCMKKGGDTCWVARSSPRCLAVSSTDTAPVAVALGAEMEVRSADGKRTIAASQFFKDDGIDYLAKDPNDLVTALLLPEPNGWESGYVKLRRRGSFDFPVLGVAAWVKRESRNGPVEDARLVLGAVAPSPTAVPAAAEALIGRPLSEETIADAAAAAWKVAKPMDNTDHLLSYRKEMVRPFTIKALKKILF